MSSQPDYSEFLRLGDAVIPRLNLEVAEKSEVFANGIPKSYHLAKLGVREKKIIALSISGFSNKEIAKMFEMYDSEVSSIINHPDAAAIIEEAAQDILKTTIAHVKSNYVVHAHEAFKTTLQLMRTSKHDRIKLEAARDITKAAGILEEKNESSTPISQSAALTIAEAMRESFQNIEEFPALGNTADLETIRAEAEEADYIEEVINASPG